MLETNEPESFNPLLSALYNLGEVNLPSYPTAILFELSLVKTIFPNIRPIV